MDHDIILNEIKDKTWIETGNEDELIKKIAYWKDRLLDLFPKDHAVFSMLDEISFEPEAAHPKLYKLNKPEAIEKGRRALGRLFDQIPEFYNKIPLIDLPFEEIIKRPKETHYLEWKPSLLQPNKIMKSVAAFLNADGGVLIIGIHEKDKKIMKKGINHDYKRLDRFKPEDWENGFKQDEDGFRICFITLLNKYGFSGRVISEFVANGIGFYKIDNKDFCMIRIKKSDEPVVINVQYKYEEETEDSQNNNKKEINSVQGNEKLNSKQDGEESEITNIINKESFYVREDNSSLSYDSIKEIVDYVFKHFRK